MERSEGKPGAGALFSVAETRRKLPNKVVEWRDKSRVRRLSALACAAPPVSRKQPKGPPPMLQWMASRTLRPVVRAFATGLILGLPATSLYTLKGPPRTAALIGVEGPSSNFQLLAVTLLVVAGVLYGGLLGSHWGLRLGKYPASEEATRASSTCTWSAFGLGSVLGLSPTLLQRWDVLPEGYSQEFMAPGPFGESRLYNLGSWALNVGWLILGFFACIAAGAMLATPMAYGYAWLRNRR